MWYFLSMFRMFKIYPAFVLKHNSNRKNQDKKEYVKKKDICNTIKSPKETKMLQFDQSKKPDQASFILHADLEWLIEKTDRYKNNPENSFTTNLGEHIPSSFSMSTISSFKRTGNKNDVYTGKDFVKKFCESLREHAMKLTSFEKKKTNLLRKEEQESFENAKICYNSKNKYVKINMWKITKY